MDITSYILGRNAGAGSASALKYLVVEELPTVGENNTIYLVPKSTSKTNNYYDEYMYIEEEWELIGDTEIDLSNYQEKLVSGTNIKTIDGTSVLGSGDIDTGLITLSYGNSTWQDFLDAYNSGKIVYCKASNGSDPSVGTQSRMAFLAYVNQSTSGPTSAEFQYYRSISSHTAAQQADQVVIYKLYNTDVWEVTTREAGTKIVAGTNMTSSYSQGVLTLNATDAKYIINIQEDSSGQVSNFNTADNKTIVRNIYNNFGTIKLNDVSIASTSIGSSNVSKYYTVERIRIVSDTSISIVFNGQPENVNINGISYTMIRTTYLLFTRNALSGQITDATKYDEFVYTLRGTNYLLGMANTTAFTPTGDYNPATKKYVDDAVAGAGGGSETYIIECTSSADTITNYNTASNIAVMQDIYDNYNTVDKSKIFLHDTRYDRYFQLSVIRYSSSQIRLIFDMDTGDYSQYNVSYLGKNNLQLYSNVNNGTISSIEKYDNKYYAPTGTDYILGTYNRNAYTPTGDYNPSTKLYTDKTHYENMTGYDATKTQVLKNINGVLTWVTEE